MIQQQGCFPEPFVSLPQPRIERVFARPIQAGTPNAAAVPTSGALPSPMAAVRLREFRFIGKGTPTRA